MKKVFFILPNNDSGTHMRYVLSVTEELKKQFKIFVFVEKDKKRNKFLQRLLNFLPIRFFVVFFQALFFRSQGVNKFYVHYSFISVLAIKCVTSIFGGTIFYWNCGIPWQYKRSFFRESFERLAYRCINFLVTGSESLIEGYGSYYNLKKEKIKIIPNWIDLNEVKKFLELHNKLEIKKELNLPEDKKIVIFVHKLVERKGAHYIPAIAKNLDEQSFFVILGDGASREKVEKDILDMNISHRVSFRGFVKGEEVEKYLFVSDLFVMPSEEEGFPHSLLEAMAFNVPFVAFDVGGVKGMVPENERNFVMKCKDISEFNKCVILRLEAKGEVDYGYFVSKFDKQVVLNEFKMLFNV
jgi:glycosyltransferase involved in cell wall biosynthesis